MVLKQSWLSHSWLWSQFNAMHYIFHGWQNHYYKIGYDCTCVIKESTPQEERVDLPLKEYLLNVFRLGDIGRVNEENTKANSATIWRL